MLKSKIQVDKHVQGIFGTIRDEKERHSKGFQIAKLYMEIKEYDTAKKYLSLFMSQRDNFAPAHKLLGQILENQGYPEKAVGAYKTSLQLDDTQKDILVRVCELYNTLDVDADTAKYWAERVEKVYPTHQLSFQLREKAIQAMKDGELNSDTGELEDLVCAELTRRPQDPVLRAKLLKLFIDTERVNEAYEHMMEVERKVLFSHSKEWYQCVLDILQEYRRESGQKINGTFHQMLLHTLNNLTRLTIENGKVTEAMDVLHKFDQTLFHVDSLGLRGDIWNVLYREMQAQFYNHVAAMLLKKAHIGRLQWKEASDLASACYLCSSTIKPPSKTAVWYGKAPDLERPLLDYWCIIACQRACETGHMMNNIGGSDGAGWIERIQEQFCTDQGKERMFSAMFSQSSKKDSRDTSFLVQNSMFTIISPEMPRQKQLKEYDAGWCTLGAKNLQHVVWMCLQNYNVGKDKIQPEYELRIFEGLQHGVLNLDTATPETLCQLDIETFLYACVHLCALRQQDRKRNTLSEPGQLTMLPSALCSALVTEQQTEWWDCAWKIYTNTAKEHLGRLRLTLQRGLETIRLVGNHGMDLSLIVHLARTFEVRTEVARGQCNNVLDFANEIASLQARAQGFWKVAVDLADKHIRGTSSHIPKQRLFDWTESLDDEEVLSYLSEGRYYIAKVAMEEGRVEDALQGFDSVATPEASYYQGQLYKKLASRELGSQILDQTGGDERNKQIALLTKSRDKFYMTLDRLRGEKMHPLNADLADEIDDVESKLARVETDGVPRDISLRDEDDEEYCTPAADLGNIKSFKEPSMIHTLKPAFVASTPRRNLTLDMSRSNKSLSVTSLVPRTRPSPERLEAQMKQFTHTQESVVQTLLEELKDRRKTLQLSQEKVISLEQEKVSLADRLHLAERERDMAVHRLEMESVRLKEDKQRFDDERHRMEDKEDDIQTKLRESERLQDKLEYEKQRVSDDKQRLKEDRERLKEQHSKLTTEWKELEERRRKLEEDRRRFEEEKREEYERQRERQRKDEEERAQRLAQQLAAPVVPQPGDQLYNPAAAAAAAAAAAYRSFQPGFEFAGQQQPANVFPQMPHHPGVAPPYGYAGQQFPPPHPLMGLPSYRYQGMPTSATHTPQRATDPTFVSRGFHEDDYYYDDEEDENANDVNVNTEESQAGNAFVLPGPHPVIPPIYPPTSTGVSLPMPGPGFFSPDKSLSGLAGVPNTASLPVAGGNSALAALLTAASQAQGATLYSVTSPGTKFPMSMTPLPVTTASSTSAVASSIVGTAVSTTPAVSSNDFTFAVKVPVSTANSTGVSAITTGTIISPVVIKPAPPETQTSVEESGDHNTSAGNDSYTEPHFEPLVTLPEVEVVTGEEDEILLVECRAKLLRFIDKQWKERGLGQIKILHHPATQKVRVVMRREQILKICANHYLTSTMTISFREGTKENNVLTWRALDFTDEETKLEQFCCRFKTEEDATKFKQQFEEGIKIVKIAEEKGITSDEPATTKSITVEDGTKKSNATATPVVKATDTANKPNLSEMFKPTSDSWNCNACYVNNPANAIECLACETARPGHEKEVEEKQAQRSTALASNMNKFGGGASGGFGTFGAGGGGFGAVAAPGIGGFNFGSVLTASGGGSGMGSKTGSASSISSMGSFTFGQKAADAMDGNANTMTAKQPIKFGAFGATTVSETNTSVTTTTSSSVIKSSIMSNLVTSIPKPTMTDSDETNQNVFGGLTFNTKPVITNSATDTQKSDNKTAGVKSTTDGKANPFASFSFGGQSSSPSVFGSTNTPDVTSFANVANDNSASGAFKPKTDFAGFQGTGKTVFGTPAKSPQKGDGEGDENEEYEPDVDFKPVIELPEIVDLKTGEEDEIVLFCNRSKLYRFDLSAKQWKDRGIGDIKLLQHRDETKYRCIMRREQVLKLCANHLLSAEMKISPLENTEKTYRWMAHDFSEEEFKQEMFAAKFKTEEIANHFKEVFESCVAALSNAPIPTFVEEKVCSIQEDKHRSTPELVSSAQTLSEMFQLKQGEWECEACYVKNAPSAIKCVSCETPKPGCEDEVAKENAKKTDASFKFGSGNTSGFAFGSFGTKDTPQKSDASASATHKPLFGGFEFKSTKEASPNSSTFSFGGSPSTSFVDSPQKTQQPTTADVSSSKPGFTFGSKDFNFAGLTPLKSDGKAKSPLKSPLKSPGGDEYYHDEEGDDIHFEPIVSLPDDYEHRTGEEDEVTLYSHRAKLFRWIDGQWKERGIGDIKVLRHPESGHVRLLMRREQVLKICLNHRLLPDLELKPMANAKGKAWVWHADDFTDSEVNHEQFAIRFKSEDVADQFKLVFDGAKTGKIVNPVKPIESDTPNKDKSKEKQKVESSNNQDTPINNKLKATKDLFIFTPQSASSTTKTGFGTFNFGTSKFGTPATTSTATASNSGFPFGNAAGIATSLPKANATQRLSASSGIGSLSIDGQKSLLEDLLAASDETEQGAGRQTEAGDVIFIGEKEPTKDQEERARHYSLPRTFYFYEDSDFSSCKGCIGCKSEEFDFSRIGQSSNNENDDVIFLYEERSSPSKKHLIDKYQLPANFYKYEHKEGCKGCPGCLHDNNEEEIFKAAQAFVTGGSGNPYYAKELDQAGGMFQATKSVVTGGTGNPYYAKELNQAGGMIQSTKSVVTGGTGNPYYANELNQAVEADIKPSMAQMTGGKGNIHYSKQLDQPDSTTPTPIFGSAAPSSVFGSTTGGLFGGPKNTGSLFGGNSGGESVFGSSSHAGGFDFAALAQQTPQQTDLVFGKKKEDKGPFQWQGAGATLFSPTKEGEYGENVEDEGPDIHFEPLVQLPEVEVKTGEEDEVQIYAQRSKLYRYDNNQWKERALGEMKILKHKQTGKYRMLMRREQVYKIACNHFITPDLKLTPMMTSETAWCWHALDYTENEPKKEQFALRFKTQELAAEFYDLFTKCQQQSPTENESENNNAMPDSTTNETVSCPVPPSLFLPQKGTAEVVNGEDDDDDDQYEDYDEEEQGVLFTKRATMWYADEQNKFQSQGLGELQVLMDDDVMGYRIRMETDDERMVCNHIICRRHTVHKSEKKKFVEWTAKDFSTDEPIKRTFKVAFSSATVVKEFDGIFKQGVKLAGESEIDEVYDSASLTGELILPDGASS